MIILINYGVASWDSAGNGGHTRVLSDKQFNNCVNSQFFYLVPVTRLWGERSPLKNIRAPVNNKNQHKINLCLLSRYKKIVSSLGIYLFIHLFIKFTWSLLLPISQTRDSRCILLSYTEQLLLLLKKVKTYKNTRLKKSKLTVCFSH